MFIYRGVIFFSFIFKLWVKCHTMDLLVVGQALKLSIQFLHFDHQPLSIAIMFLMPFGSIIKATPRFGVVLKCFLICVNFHHLHSWLGFFSFQLCFWISLWLPSCLWSTPLGCFFFKVVIVIFWNFILVGLPMDIQWIFKNLLFTICFDLHLFIQ